MPQATPIASKATLTPSFEELPPSRVLGIVHYLLLLKCALNGRFGRFELVHLILKLRRIRPVLDCHSGHDLFMAGDRPILKFLLPDT